MTQKVIEKYKPYVINYTKSNGEKTVRTIVPLNEAPKNIKALDITDLNAFQRQFLLEKQEEYCTYVEQHLAIMFDFESWYEHTMDGKPPKDLVKYRTFTVDSMQTVTEEI